jgi:hypothetical protein
MTGPYNRGVAQVELQQDVKVGALGIDDHGVERRRREPRVIG